VFEHRASDRICGHQAGALVPYDGSSGVQYRIRTAIYDPEAAEGAVQQDVIARLDPDLAQRRGEIRSCHCRTAS